MNQIHKLKILPEYFEAVIDGRKKFEIRNADRNYNVGDILDMCEYDSKTCTYTGRRVLCFVTYILDLQALLQGHVILSIDAFTECEVIGL